MSRALTQLGPYAGGTDRRGRARSDAAALTALILCSTMSCGRTADSPTSAPSAPSRAHAPSRPATSAPLQVSVDSARCAIDPNVPWLTPQDRTCTSDLECTTIITRQCGMFAVAARAAARVSTGEYACWPLPPDVSKCPCGLPGFEQRCFEGCCQSRISGATGVWWPLPP
jgi:hypothetical protein